VTKVAGKWLTDPGVQHVFQALAAHGHQVFVVGGCVRNALLGVSVADVDMSTIARPIQVIEIAENAGFAAHPTGLDHGTVTVVANGTPIEVTTFRRDVETDGRRAVVAFADTMEEDALRRDFTMNALYATCDGDVVDPLNGLPDLQARLVRFIEDPQKRIQEDYLRILRFFRFHAYYGDQTQGFDTEGLAACAQNIDGLSRLSKERIGAETFKLFGANDPAPSVAAIERIGALSMVLPGALSEHLAILVHLEQQHEILPDALRRLAVVGGESPGEALKLSKRVTKDLAAITDHAREGTDSAKIAYLTNANIALDATLVRHALMGQHLPESYKSQIELGAKAVFPVKAADLPQLHGKALGDKLRQLENQWIASGFQTAKADLLK